jgi:hypothetical protein
MTKLTELTKKILKLQKENADLKSKLAKKVSKKTIVIRETSGGCHPIQGSYQGHC